MSDATAITLGGIGFSIVAAGAVWIQARLNRKRQAEDAAIAAELERRLRSPDLAAIEKHLGHPLPRSLHALYADQELVLSDDVLIGVPNPVEKDSECYVAWFEPGDLQNLLAQRWPGCEGLFPIATGDEFLVELRDPDPEVLYHLHETGEKRGTGARLSAFVSAPRRPVPDE